MALAKGAKQSKKARKGQRIEVPITKKNMVDDDTTDKELAKQHAGQNPRTLRKGPKNKKYYTARGGGVTWDPQQEEKHQVKAFVRDTAVLQATRKWEELVGRGVTHLTVEDDENTLKVIPEMITSIQTLRSFHLMWSQVKVIPDYLLQMGLKELCFQKCHLKHVDNIHISSALKRLDLVNCGLKKLPLELGELIQLVHLDLTGNHLKVLPLSISNLKELETLKICGNSLTEIPHSITELENLDTLDASQNQIREMSQHFGKLSELITLRLSHNQLSVLPNSFEKLIKLKNLYLGFNRFNEVPRLLGELPILQTLNMVSNHIINIPRYMPSLTTLLLDRNDLTELNEPLFLCDNLQTLSVQYNKFKVLPPLIARLRKLRALYIGGNDINKLPEDVCAITSLRHVVVKDTKLQELPHNFDRLSRLSVVDIDNTELDPQYVYELKKGGIPGLMEFHMRKKRLTIYPPGIDGNQYPDADGDEQRSTNEDFSDHGSSQFDEFDDSATDDEILDDNRKSVYPPGIGTRKNNGVTFRESQLGDGKGTISQRREKKVDTMMCPGYVDNEPLTYQDHISTPLEPMDFPLPNGSALELTVGKNRGSMIVSNTDATTSFMNAIKQMPDVGSPTAKVIQKHQNVPNDRPASTRPKIRPKPAINRAAKPQISAKAKHSS